MSEPMNNSQLVLDVDIAVEGSVDGVEMGVLENAMPFLTQTGLAKMAGVAQSVISDISREWAEAKASDSAISKGRLSFLIDYLARHDYNEPNLYIETKVDGAAHYAYPDIVCTAIIEYYAFESTNKNETASNSFRSLATFGLQKFIYQALGYSPEEKWKYHNDRISILQDSAPDGYFIVFKEISGMAVDIIKAGLPVNDRTIPDISVGIAWAKHWETNDLTQKFGERQKYSHNYPPYYPQSASNPQDSWAYPDGALPEFRQWFRHTYLLTKFPKYILTKSKMLLGGKQEAAKIANLYEQKKASRPPRPIE